MTVKVIGPPAVALAGALMAKCVADDTVTLTELLPVIELLTVSVAIRDWLPDDFNVAINVSAVAERGSEATAFKSLLVMRTVPASPMAVLL